MKLRGKASEDVDGVAAMRAELLRRRLEQWLWDACVKNENLPASGGWKVARCMIKRNAETLNRNGECILLLPAK